MSELWVKVKKNPWVVAISSSWILLAIVFGISRYSIRLKDDDILDVVWNKAADFILLSWLSHTLVAGVFAVVAALIGAKYLIHSTSQQIASAKENLEIEIKHRTQQFETAERQRIKSVLSSCAAIYSIVSDELESSRTDKIDLKHLWNITSRLAELDGEFFWLSIAVNRKIEHAFQQPVGAVSNVIAASIIQSVAMNDICLQLIQKLENGYTPISESSIDSEKITFHLSKTTQYIIDDLGEVKNYYSWPV